MFEKILVGLDGSALQTAALLKAGVIRAAPAGVRLTTPRDLLNMCAALTTVGAPSSP